MTLPELSDALERLVRRVDELEARWRDLPEGPALERRPRPGGWCAKELLGHLVDSASNNHQRFVRAAFQDDLRFPGYDQDAWVELQGYATAPWSELLSLWANYNRQLARVLANLPRELLGRATTEHDFDRIAYDVREPGSPCTLAWFAGDYVAHLEHHLSALERLVDGS